MDPTPKSLILDLLSTLGQGAAPVRALVAAGALFGMPENNIRVALARLLARGLVDRDERGSYRLGREAAGVSQLVTSWRRSEERVRSWRGDWVGVQSAGLGRRERRALELLGFRNLSPGLALRPNNLSGGIERVRETLGNLKLEAPVFLISDFDAETEAQARALWDVAALREAYHASIQTLEQSGARLAELPQAQAMVESFVLGGRVIRQIVLDPLLPEDLIPNSERRALLEALRRYDRLGRAAWSEFLSQFGVPHRRTPAHLGVVESAERLAAAAGGN